MRQSRRFLRALPLTAGLCGVFALAVLLAAMAGLARLEAKLPAEAAAQAMPGLRGLFWLLALLAMLPALLLAWDRFRIRQNRRHTFLEWHDVVTGLPNRAQFDDRLAATLALARREERHVAVLMVELGGLETAIRQYGQPIGESLLRMAAERLRTLTRTEDLVARLDGGCFAVIQMGRPQPEGAIRLSERALAALARPFAIEDLRLTLRADIGIAFGPAPEADEVTLPVLAITALRRAQTAAQGRAVFHEEGMEPSLLQRLAVETELREAVSRGALALHFQPQVHLPSRRIVACEALLRWPHPSRGLIEPSAFIPAAEETGLINRLGAWALRQACMQAASWPVPLRVAVNLSPAQIRQGDILALVEEALEASGLEPRRLEIEITESLLLEDAPATLALLTALRAKGVRIAIDDFGTGYSSLAHLWRFPFDKLKIDRCFVTGLMEDERRQAIVQSILALGHALRLTVTAEGIETEEQARYLTGQGCEEGQGFLFSRPIEAEALRALIAQDGLNVPG